MSSAPSADVRSAFGAQELARRIGLDFVHQNGAEGRYYYIEIMGVGGALFDFDNDGDLDLYAIQGGPIDPRGESGGKDRLFLNRGIDPATDLPYFEPADEDVGTASGYGMGVATGDFDGDGWTDLYVTQIGANVLLRNVQGRRFENVTARAGVGGDELSSSATFVDLDRDGLQDLYVVSYLRYTLARDKKCSDLMDLPEYCGPQSYDPERDRLYRNLGQGRFVEVEAGIDQSGPGLGVVAGDFDGNGYSDLYVANDQASNFMWLNQGPDEDGGFVSFRDEAMFRGSAVDARGKVEASMGVDAGDVDGDGDEDLFTTHLIGETNTLYLNQGDGHFEDGSLRYSFGRAGLPWTGFGCALEDLDLDGRLDLYVANGAVRANSGRRAAGEPWPYQEPDLIFLSSPSGDFVDATDRVSGLQPDLTGRGVAIGDIDNDGDADWVVFQTGGPLRLFLNTTLGGPSGPDWLGLDLRLPQGSPALGTQARLRFDDGRVLLRTVRSGRSYMSAADPRLRFGLGGGPRPTAIDLIWPDGTAESRPVPRPGQYHRWTMRPTRTRP